jgi:hypothetical protein
VTGWVIFWVWVAGILPAGRKVTWFMLNDLDDGILSLEKMDYAMAGFIGLTGGALWPLAALLSLLLVRRKPTNREAESKKKELQSRIAELEAENNRLRRINEGSCC